MRIVLAGKNDAAALALDFLCERGEQALVLGTRGDDGRDGWQRSLVGAARRLGVEREQPARINAPAAIERLRSWRADLLVSIQYDQILKAPVFEAIGCPCLNLHFALLPRNRGVAPIAWAILAGDEETGATLHHMITDIDAGDVVAQRAVPIEPEDSARALYDKVSAAAAELFREAYPFGPGLLARRLPQDPRRATYHRNGELDFARRRVDWRTDARALQRWIRAFIFPPFQLPEFVLGGRVLAITALSGALGARGGAPGTVLEASGELLEIAAVGGSLRILGCAVPGGGRVSLAELAAGLREGTVLTSGEGGGP